MYEQSRQLAQTYFQDWLSREVFSLGWFVLLGLLIIVYIVWLKLLDKKRTTELLLIGSLAAVAYIVNNMILGDMLVQQYTSSWKGYALWSAIGFAFFNFAIIPILTLVGVLEFKHNWNVFYTFLFTYAFSFGVRLVFLWITGTQKRHAKKDKS